MGKMTKVHTSKDLTGKDASILSIVPNRNMNGKTAQCTIIHDALDAPMTQIFKIEVQYKPEKPEMKIENPNCGEEDASDDMKIICQDDTRLKANPR